MVADADVTNTVVTIQYTSPLHENWGKLREFECDEYVEASRKYPERRRYILVEYTTNSSPCRLDRRYPDPTFVFLWGSFSGKRCA